MTKVTGWKAPYTKYIKHGRYILRRKTTYRIQEYGVPKDEYDWAVSWRKIADLWTWHHCLGLHQGKPHPMGKDLKELMREYNQYHADRYKESNMEPPNCYMTEGVI